MHIRRIHISIYLTIVMAILGISLKINAQQTSARNHYFIQEYLLNPAFTGAKNYNPFYISYRRQFSGIDNSPEFFSASGYYVINNESNVAGSIYNLDQGGAFNQTVGQFNYSHDYHFSSWAHITIGGGLVLNQFSASYEGVDVLDPNDPVLTSGNTSNTAIDGALGIKYFLKRFKLGLSVDNLLASKVSNETNLNLYNKLSREFRAITQYDFTIDSLLHIEPLVVYKYQPESKLSQLDFSILANYNNSYTLGLMYRTNSAFSLIGGIQYKKFYFLYSHEVNVNGLAGAVGNSNEITAGYRFKLHPDKMFVDNDMDGIINRKDSCPDKFGHKRYKGCPIDEYALLVANDLDSITDSLVINDSLIFKLQKLSNSDMDLVKLYLIDDEGEVVYQAIKTENGFLFKYLPSNEHYYFRLDNLPDSLHFEAMEINVSFGDDNESILAKSINTSNYYEYQRLGDHIKTGPRLLVINDENQVIAIGVDNGGVFKFDYLPDEGSYNYKLVDADSLELNEDCVIEIDYNNQIKDLQLVFNQLELYSGELPDFLDEEELSMAFIQSSLFLVNTNGESIYKAEYSDNGFVFKYLPQGEKYLFKLEDLSSDIQLLDLQVRIFEGENEYTVLSKFNPDNGYFEYVISEDNFEFSRLNGNLDDPKLLMLNDQNQVMSVGIMEEGVFKFGYLPDGDNYHYILLNSDSASIEEYLHIVEDFNNEQNNMKLIYNKIKSRYEFSANLLDEEALEDLKMNIEMTEENKKLVDVLEVFSTNDQSSIDKQESESLDHFYTIQIGAYKTKMNIYTYENINKVFGDKFNMYFDENLQMDKYAIGRFEKYNDALQMNKNLLEKGFKKCFVIGIKDEMVVPISQFEK